MPDNFKFDEFFLQEQFRKQTFFPSTITQIGMESEVKELLEKIEKVNHDTAIPLCPFFLLFPILPCIFFAIPIVLSQRKSQIEEILHEWNQTIGLTQGIFAEWNEDWHAQFRSGGQRGVVHNPELKILMNLPKRQEYCQQNGIEFQTPATQFIAQ